MEVNLYLKEPHCKTPTPIYAKIYYHPISFKYYLSEKVIPTAWDTGRGRIKTNKGVLPKEYVELNSKVQTAKNDILEVYRRYLNDHENSHPTKDDYKYLLDVHFKKVVPVVTQIIAPVGVSEFFNDFITRCKDGTRVHRKTSKPITPNTVKTYCTAYKHFTNYERINNLRLTFDAIDLRFYESFKSYLMKDLQFSNNSIGKHIQLLKAVLSDGFELDVHTNQSFLKKGFAGFREEADTIHLNEVELAEMQTIDLTNKPSLEVIRDYFLMGCWTGVRYSDYAQIQPHKVFNNIIQIRQTKTQQLSAIPVDRRVLAIFRKYNNELPRLISNQKTNKGLKELCKLIDCLQTEVIISYTKGGKRLDESRPKWSLVSTHTARRSFATNKYLEGVPTKTIMAITGHRTEVAFFKYIKLHQTDHAKIMLHHMMESA